MLVWWFLIQCGAFSPRRPEGNTEPTPLQALFASFFREKLRIDMTIFIVLLALALLIGAVDIKLQ
jgi:hypothetical protein